MNLSNIINPNYNGSHYSFVLAFERLHRCETENNLFNELKNDRFFSFESVYFLFCFVFGNGLKHSFGPTGP